MDFQIFTSEYFVVEIILENSSVKGRNCKSQNSKGESKRGVQGENVKYGEKLAIKSFVNFAYTYIYVCKSITSCARTQNPNMCALMCIWVCVDLILFLYARHIMKILIYSVLHISVSLVYV